MTPTEARRNALWFLAFSVATVACMGTAALWGERWPALLVLYIVPLAAFGVLLYLARRRRVRIDTRFAASHGGFTTGMSDRPVMAVSAVLFISSQIDDALETRHVWFRVFVPVTLVVVVVMWTWLIWRGHPRLQLRPEGILVRSTPRRRFVPWEALPVGRLPIWARRQPKQSPVLHVPEPELIEPPSYEPRVILGDWDVDEDLLVYAIDWYATHPEDRPLIGTQEELDRLNARYDATAAAL
ncbi:hypothetical protein CS0771_30920 [Catellatospora sp. IY07-71]|uniref:hypothetical protein n=1 Tax=Catellatospora sp. IY07-71 TaxID=2728827 RepID=UPI001BB366AE|nr:hypothetical protein [Catellatospora sp. IY07-71]BCJ73548.1 hypothetical protein CS0771_30920 [Catellatospora sp. IY07-71]